MWGNLISLGRLAAKYVAARGGWKAVPGLALKTAAILKNGGPAAFLAKTGILAKRLAVEEAAFPLLGREDRAEKGRRRLAEAFAAGGTLVLDHMYGGGANDYRERRIREIGVGGKAVLLLTWDFFNGMLRGRASLDDGETVFFHTAGLNDILNLDFMRFDHILLNELVLWSEPGFSGNHHEALPLLLDTVAKITKKHGARLEIAVHDYYPLCPNYTLLESGSRFCNVPVDASRCKNCLRTCGMDIPENLNLASWRGSWQKLFDVADEVRAFSRASIEIMARRFAFRAGQIKVAPHEPLCAFANMPAMPAAGPMRIGIVGNITRHKGADVARELAAMLGPEESIVILGELEGKRPANIIAHGEYRREELPALVEKYGITIAFIPSIWPETFCYTAGECMQMKLPLVVFPLGAQAERTREYELGKVAQKVCAKAALDALKKLDSLRQLNLP